jgi:hypothetical protein
MKKYEVKIVKKATCNSPKITLSTTTHGEGERYHYIKRNLLNLNQSQSRNWKQVIVIDHSSRKYVNKIILMVECMDFPENREIIWLTGGKPTGNWGRLAHNEVLKRCTTPFFGFHCDDNFVSKNNYEFCTDILDKNPKLGFIISNGFITAANKPLFKFSLGEIDLGCPVFRKSESFDKYLPDLGGFPEGLYTWDWSVLSGLVSAGCSFSNTPVKFIGYYFGKEDERSFEDIIKLNKYISIEDKNFTRVWKKQRKTWGNYLYPKSLL